MEWIVARWLTFIATLLVAGACAVGVALIPRAPTDDDTRQAIARDAARVGIGALLALIPASLLRLADQVLALQSPGDPILHGLDALLMSTTWGTGFLWQCVAMLMAGVGCVCASRAPRASTRITLWWMLATVGATGLCITPALQGHAIGSEEYTALAVSADIAHVIGASVWLGALGVIGWLGITLPDTNGVLAPDRAALAEARLRILVPLVPPIALPGAAMLLASGFIASVLHLRDVSDLWREDWGRYVLAKMIIVCVIVVLGALNWRRLGPQLRRSPSVMALRKSLVTELVLALLVLLITAVLVVTPLPGE